MKTNPRRVHYEALRSPQRTFAIAHGQSAACFPYPFLELQAQNQKLQKHASPEQLYQQRMSSCALHQPSTAAEVILLLSLQEERSG